MPKFHLIGCEVHVGGNRDTTVVKGADNDGVTLPELYVLRAVHGGPEHVHSEVIVGEVERSAEEERERLSLIYGYNVVAAVFPGVSPLPTTDDTFAALAERDEAVSAAKDAMAAAKARRTKPKAKEAEPAPVAQTPAAAIPDLTANK